VFYLVLLASLENEILSYYNITVQREKNGIAASTAAAVAVVLQQFLR